MISFCSKSSLRVWISLSCGLLENTTFLVFSGYFLGIADNCWPLVVKYLAVEKTFLYSLFFATCIWSINWIFKAFSIFNFGSEAKNLSLLWLRTSSHSKQFIFIWQPFSGRIFLWWWHFFINIWLYQWYCYIFLFISDIFGIELTILHIMLWQISSSWNNHRHWQRGQHIQHITFQ